MTDNKENVAYLRKAMSLIEDPKNWIKGRYATTETGAGCLPEEPSAKCFCASGALMHATRSDMNSYIGAFATLYRAVLKTGFKNVPAMNDNKDTTHEDVLNLYKTAIGLAS